MKKPVCESLHVESKLTSSGTGCSFGCVTIRGIVNLHNVQTHFIYSAQCGFIYLFYYSIRWNVVIQAAYTMCVCLFVCFVLFLFSFLDTVLWQHIFRTEYSVFF